MKRLTHRNPNGIAYFPECTEKCDGPSGECSNCKTQDDICESLCKYEEAEEARHLLKLPLSKEDFENVCEAVHNAWWVEKIRQGVKNHPDMIPYKDLEENVKEYDRVTVREVIYALLALNKAK